ncbi:MAG TPA: MBL fold metallo-hydrolase [Planctomycetaceae bacterium]|nr:MBL fold metallo-hydrolase [Planctomycetaceae bacterium]
MRVHLLGTGGYHPNERRHTACVMLPEAGVVLDAGTAFFRVAGRLATRDLDIFLSHAHLDHIAGLTYILVPLLSGKLARARLHSRAETLDAVRTHLFAQPVFPVMPPYEFRPLGQSVELPGGGVLTHCPLKSHPGGAIGYRIDWPGKSLAYITDTAVDGSYTELLRRVDLLIHECNFRDESAALGEKTGHSHTSAVARLAREAGVGRLVLTHFDPQHAEDDPIGLYAARAFFPATEIGEDLMEIEL